MTFAVLLLLAANLDRGRILDPVPTAGNSQQTYALYLPSNYTPERAWPVLYCLDPRARGRLAVERFSKAAEAEGFIVAGSNNSRNGPMEPIRKAIDAMLHDTSSILNIDPKRMYAAGFSGGSRIALSWGTSGQLAGVIACGAAFGQPDQPKKVPFALFSAAGTDDFNYDELHALSLALASDNARQRFVEFAGGHEWLPESLALEALQFFNGKLPTLAAVASKEDRRQAGRLRGLLQEIELSSGKGRERLVERLRREADLVDDTTDRRLARRALSGWFIGAIERASAALENHDRATAIRLLEGALLIRPDAASARTLLDRARTARP